MTVVLETAGLMKSFGGVQVIDDLSMQLHDGEALGIVGPNGAGKTTLFNLITGVYRPDAGRVTFDGKDITGLPRQERCREGIGRTFQIPQAVLGHERVRERARVRRLRAEHDGARELRALRADARAHAARPQGQPAGRDAAAAGPQAARARPRARRRPQGPAPGRDRRRAHRGRGGDPHRHHQGPPQRGHLDHLDRAHRARPARGRAAHRRHQLRPQPHRGRAATRSCAATRCRPATWGGRRYESSSSSRTSTSSTATSRRSSRSRSRSKRA